MACQNSAVRQSNRINKNICKSIREEVVTQVIVQDVGAEEDSEKVQVSDQHYYMETNLWQRSSDADVNWLNCDHEWCTC